MYMHTPPPLFLSVTSQSLTLWNGLPKPSMATLSSEMLSQNQVSEKHSIHASPSSLIKEKLAWSSSQVVIRALGLSDLTFDKIMDGRGGRVLVFFSLLLTPPFFPLLHFLTFTLSLFWFSSAGRSMFGIGLFSMAEFWRLSKISWLYQSGPIPCWSPCWPGDLAWTVSSKSPDITVATSNNLSRKVLSILNHQHMHHHLSAYKSLKMTKNPVKDENVQRGVAPCLSPPVKHHIG